MHSHGIALLRWLTWHRYQLPAATGLVLVAVVLLGATPLNAADPESPEIPF